MSMYESVFLSVFSQPRLCCTEQHPVADCRAELELLWDSLVLEYPVADMSPLWEGLGMAEGLGPGLVGRDYVAKHADKTVSWPRFSAFW